MFDHSRYRNTTGTILVLAFLLTSCQSSLPQSPTSTPSPVGTTAGEPTPSPAETPLPTSTLIPTPTPFPQAVTGAAGADLYSGPGTAHWLVGQVPSRESLTLLGQSRDGNWLQANTAAGVRAWIAASDVEPSITEDDLPVATEPPPAQPVDWQGPPLEHLCVVLEETYPQIETGFSLPFFDTIWPVLAGLGLPPLSPDSDCDAHLTVQLTARALGKDYYTLDGSSRLHIFSGAAVSGTMRLEAPGTSPLLVSVLEERSPPGTIELAADEGENQPQDAPFDRVWPTALLEGLCQIWGPSALAQVILTQANDGGLTLGFPNDVYLSAVQLLRDSGPDGAAALPDLLRALEDPVENVRASAADGLGVLGANATEAVPPLVEHLDDGSPLVRRAAINALGEIGPGAEAAVPMLAHIVTYRDGLEQSSAVESLGKIGSAAREATPALIAASDDEHWSVRYAALHALAGVGLPASEFIPLLTDALEDEWPGVRSLAAELLGEIGPEAWGTVPRLIPLLESDSLGAQREAAYALRSITGQDFGRDSERWQQWWNEQQ